MKKNKLRVWGAPVRMMHWLLVLSIAGAWFTSGQTGAAHEYAGYATAAIVASRLMWGFFGKGYARFSQFVRPAGATAGYFRAVLSGPAPRYLGHNPLGGWMVVALLACVGLVALTGWAATSDLLWGYAWPVLLHTILAWTLVGLIALHIAGVVFTSWQHRENLVAAMLTGDKDAQP